MADVRHHKVIRGVIVIAPDFGKKIKPPKYPPSRRPELPPASSAACSNSWRRRALCGAAWPRKLGAPWEARPAIAAESPLQRTQFQPYRRHKRASFIGATPQRRRLSRQLSRRGSQKRPWTAGDASPANDADAVRKASQQPILWPETMAPSSASRRIAWRGALMRPDCERGETRLVRLKRG
jgi:hypothetical protein